MSHYLVFALLAAGAGAGIAMQASANERFRHHIDSPLFAAFFSICGTVLTISIVMLALRPSVPDMGRLRNTEWWNWIGGPLGALFVLAGTALTRELGAALFIALVVAGQLLCAILLDHFALLGLKQQAMTSGRIFGAILVVAGVACIKYL